MLSNFEEVRKIEAVKIYLAGAMSGLSFEEQNQWRKRMKSIFNSAVTCERVVFKPSVCNPCD